MKIEYQDEYGITLFQGSSVPAAVGDIVIIQDEEYRVKSRIFMPMRDAVIVELTQTMIRTPVKENMDPSRLTSMHNAIVATNARQDAVEKRNRALTEEVRTVRKHINAQIQREKK
jgi:hypothetical protein